jgi:hypothetical protein
VAQAGAGGGGAGRAPQRRPRNRSGRTAAFLVIGVAVLGGAGFGVWAGLNRKPPLRAGDPTSGIPSEGLGVKHPPRPGAPAAPPAEPAAPPTPAPVVPPSTPAAVERKPGQTLREIQALVAAGKISAARAVAEKFLKSTPTGPEAEEIMGLTGVHPHP